jgi:hypothetical protein
MTNTMEPTGLEAAEKAYSEVYGPAWNSSPSEAMPRALRAAIRAYLAARPSMGEAAVKATVKPLDWVENKDQSDAVMPFGAWYFVHQKGGEWFIHHNDKQGHPTREAAKAAAQAHFESQILSALDVPAQAEGVKGARARLLVRLADFDNEVAEHLANETERADLWEEIDVSVSDLRAVLNQ